MNKYKGLYDSELSVTEMEAMNANWTVHWLLMKNGLR